MLFYKDMLLKLAYHKEQVIKAFIKKGYYPKDDEISERLSQIDNRLALFKAYISKSGSKFNTKEMNYCFSMIAKDLEFLYKIIEELSTIELNKLNFYVETHLTYLEDLAKYYKKRTDEEMNTTSLGKTIFFQTSNWKTETKDNLTLLDLDKIELIQGTKIAILANINNVESNTIKFRFEASDAKYDFEALPYGYNNQTYNVPGTLSIRTEELDLKGSIKVNGYIEIPMEIDKDNDYYILGGLNKMFVTSKITNNVEIIDFCSEDIPFIATEDCYISFYVVEGTTIEYSFNKKPNHTNFSMQDGMIQTNSDMNRIFIDAPENFTCTFRILDDGKIYASKEDGIISSSGKLLYDGNENLRDFHIREYSKKNKTEYRLRGYMTTNEEIPAVIESICIKEI